MITSLLSIGALTGLAVAQSSKKKSYESQKTEKEKETTRNIELQEKLTYLNGLDKITKEKSEDVKETFTNETFSNGYDNLVYNDSIIINFEYRAFRLVTIFLTCTLLMLYVLRGKSTKSKIPFLFLICCILFPLFIAFNIYTIYISYHAPNQYLSGVPVFILLLSFVLSAKILYEQNIKNSE